ncbi:hypothetical protein KAFR_0K00680 [Kazachstania africana CBS 2517]|uniref:t-SNARE coiled-coil homology domain-containing protein n=1 Tax=Kazachstania africana (strain ATCC 22294 / BCRC 22015 / CBS 2517 / CECT 1963 / NBRC 1671 / NRRL Y-8276) TaxID=1071382 RepID=H2B1C3_KAZAF|nr:hypothetical protein KAFR_0K00680 [Kazachstania africana CBS 2517]CCF60423.1 hypothetical protein KAFR_0K00680 [Kazachstania africana CBS 2517]
MELLKLSYEIERLGDIVDERKRLVEALNIRPSSNDNVILKTQMDKILGLLQELAKTASELKPTDFETLKDRIVEYNSLLSDRLADDDSSIDKTLYLFQAQITPGKSKKKSSNSSDSSSQESSKRVRFKDEISYNESPQYGFQPYHDYEEDEEEATIFNTPLVSNEELFASQRQQLDEQDSHLDLLSASMQRTHGLSLDINKEVTEQNTDVLADLENMVDSSGRNLERAQRRLQIFTKTARENGPCATIVLLSIILFFLLIVL